MIRTAFVPALLLALCTAAHAQQVRLQIPQGPMYVGQPVDIRVQAEDFEDDPQPEVRVPDPSVGHLELQSVSPNISSSITIINGRISQMKSVRFVYQYRYISTVAGLVEIGPFVVTQGSVERVVGPVQIDLRAVPRSDRLRVVLRVPDGSRFVGQRVPVTLELWLEEQLRENMRSYSLNVPLFDLTDSFRLVDEPNPKAESHLMIHMADGAVTLPASVRRTSWRDQNFVVVSVTRTLIPLRSGEHTPGPTTVTVEEGIRWQRDFFGGRRATHVRMWSAVDEGPSFRVDSVPRAGQPESFAGAVGRGYTLDVSADRTVVQVGDPITLTFRLSGEGNLESAALPPLDADGLLPADAFRVPEGDMTGRLEQGAKEFTAVVRVLDESVREIPALAYSWFDPDREGYVTTLSRPIALSVRAAEVIAAQDVFSGADESAEDEIPEESRAPERWTGSFARTGADLAIEKNPAALLAGRGGPFGGPWVPITLYAGASLLVAAALFDRRRRDVDPALLRRRRLLDGEVRRIRDAVTLPGDESVGELARALRTMLAEVPEARTPELDSFLGECDAQSYAPRGRARAAGADPQLHARALELARRIAETAK